MEAAKIRSIQEGKHDLAALYPAHLAFVRNRFDKALELAGLERVVVGVGAPRMLFRDDWPHPFRGYAMFKWWVPVVDNPHCYVVHAKGAARPKVLFWQPRDYWHLPAAAPTAYWTEHCDVISIADPAELGEHLPSDLSRTAFLGEEEPAADALGFGARNPDALLTFLEHYRGYKTDYEVRCFELATERGVRAHRAAEAAFRAGASEFEIHVEYQRAAGQTERDLPYGNIIALNEMAAVLHYQHQRSASPVERRSFLIDAGAQHAGYACDITRTYSGADDDFAALVAGMDAAQRRLCAAVRPGVPYPKLQELAHLEVGALLKEHGLVDLSPEAAFAARVTHAFFPHGIGHLLGLNVHDSGGFSKSDRGGTLDKPAGEPYLRLTRPIEEHMVFTVEPGLYFIPLLLDELKAKPVAKSVRWDRVAAFLPFGGVRIEDDVLVTKTGCRNLTREEFGRQAV
jgi:Xaa-Pro dipeptidase